MRYLHLILISYLLVGCGLAHAVESGQSAQERGAAAEQRGDLNAAITQWGEAIAQLQAGQTTSPSAAQTRSLNTLLIRRGEALRSLGFYRKAQSDLQSALTLSQQIENVTTQSLSAGALGHLYDVAGGTQLVGGGSWPDSEPLLQQSLSLAERSSRPALISVAAARLGERQLRLQAYADAQKSFGRSLEEAIQANNKALQLSARISLVHVATARGQSSQALEQLQLAADEIDDHLSIQQQATSWLAISHRAEALGIEAQALNSRALNAAMLLTASLDDPRLSAAIYAQMGALYEARGLLSQAVLYTEKAMLLAPTEHDLALQWEWRLGRLLSEAGDTTGAISAYRRAAFHVQAIRQDIPVTYSGGRSSFRETLAPIFLELADLLLQQSDRETDNAKVQPLLIEAQDIVERIKASELQDYYRDVCIINQSQSVGDQLNAGTAVLYPVILPDRLALLIRIQNSFYHVSVPVTGERLTQTAQLFAEQLRYAEPGYRESSRQLHYWLIAPIGEFLDQNTIKTIVFIPDGALRTVPLSALWDGKQFIVERYAVATAPGLTLLNAERISGNRSSTLFAGLSRPGTVVNELPESMFQSFLPQQQRSITRGSEGRRQVIIGKSPGPNKDSTLEQLQDALALPGVKVEIDALSQSGSSTVLLDEQFELGDFESEVLANPYRVVHIASHGFFGGTAKDSWIMTHDRLLDMDRLSNLFKPKEFADEPIELLVLSACQTAEGNDRAPLGLSGVALASGARSVLGSLWPVADLATTQLMQTFYDGLSNSDNTKVDALRQAQLAVLQNREYRHPFFWASFVLIGSWL